ncbi:ciliary microtubule inner protein 2B-like [Centruroides vittatus]|uniref:ciliary microtubule inner protein 2B-like n=1 Tax=Centruroides vittatus TaxID=120091 RepID=UPI0035104225
MASDDPTLPYPHPQIAPEPHFISGYTGFCPQKKYQFGKTSHQATNELLSTYYSKVAPRLDVIHPFPESKFSLNIVQNRHPPVGDIKLRDDIVPGYTGHIPTKYEHYGKRYRAHCLDAIANFEINQMKSHPPDPKPTCDEFRGSPFPLKCTSLDPPLSYSDPLSLPPGSYNRGQRVPGIATGWTPHDKPESYQPTGILSEERLGPIWPESIPNIDFLTEKPYFMSNADPRKFFIPGYTGYVPGLRYSRGMAYSTGTNRSLCKFTHENAKRRTMLKRPVRVDWIEPVEPPSGRTPVLKYLPNHGLPFLDTGVMPDYTGHIPGYRFVCGNNYGLTSLKLARLNRCVNKTAQ